MKLKSLSISDRSNNTLEGKKDSLKIENLNHTDISVCKDLTFDEQTKICGGSITGTGSSIRYYYR